MLFWYWACSAASAFYLLALGAACFWQLTAPQERFKRLIPLTLANFVYCASGLYSVASFSTQTPESSKLTTLLIMVSGFSAFGFYLDYLSITTPSRMNVRALRFIPFAFAFALLADQAYSTFHLRSLLFVSRTQAAVNPYIQAMTGQLDFTPIGKLFFGTGASLNLVLTSSILIWAQRHPVTHTLLTTGLMLSLVTTLNDNLMGLTSFSWMMPLGFLGDLPETLHFLKNGFRRYEKSQKTSLLSALKLEQKNIVHQQVIDRYWHDTKKILRPLTKSSSAQISGHIEKLSEIHEYYRKQFHSLEGSPKESAGNPYSLIREILELLDIPKDVKVTVNPKKTKWLPVSEEALQITALNIISNAIEAFPEEQPVKKLEIDIDQSPEILTVSFSNNAPPIPAHIRTKLFTPGTKGKKEGDGLGLNSSREAALRAGGILYLSAENQNTRFVLELPALQ